MIYEDLPYIDDQDGEILYCYYYCVFVMKDNYTGRAASRDRCINIEKSIYGAMM